jgi:hypothetical protein
MYLPRDEAALLIRHISSRFLLLFCMKSPEKEKLAQDPGRPLPPFNPNVVFRSAFV